jgi:hypothetical protein
MGRYGAEGASRSAWGTAATVCGARGTVSDLLSPFGSGRNLVLTVDARTGGDGTGGVKTEAVTVSLSPGVE